MFTAPADGFTYVLRHIAIGNQVATGAANVAVLVRSPPSANFITVTAADNVPAFGGRNVDMRFALLAADELFFWSNVGMCSCAVTAYRLSSS